MNNCHICGGQEHRTAGHAYWPESEAEAYAEQQPQPAG